MFVRRRITASLLSALVFAGLVGAGCATTTAPTRGPEITSDVRASRGAGDGSITRTSRAQQLFVRGMTHAQLDNHEVALDLFSQALSLAPNTPAILSALAESYEAVGNYSNALFNARRARELAPEVSHYYFHLAQLHLVNGESGRAAEVYEEMRVRFPENLQVLYELGRVLSISGRFSAAVEVYRDLLDAVGDDRDLQDEILRLYVRAGDEEGIERVLLEMIDSLPEDGHLRRMLADLYVGQGRAADAARQLEAGLERSPGDVQTMLSLTDVYRAMGEIAKADQLLEQATTLEASTPEELMAQVAPLFARASSDADALETAVQILQRVLELNPDDAEALIMLGEARRLEGRLAEAAELSYQALERNPRRTDLWVQTAATFFQAGDLERAIDVADEGLMLFPGSVSLLRISGLALMEAYRNREAIERLREAVAIIREDGSASDAELSDLFGALGLLHTRTNDVEASDEAYEAAIAANPHNAIALNNYAYGLAERGEDLDRALALAQQAVELGPDVASFLDTLGWVYFQRGELSDALEWIEKATGTGDASAVVFEHLGDVHHALGDPAAAREAWDAAYEMNPDSTSIQQKLGIQ